MQRTTAERHNEQMVGLTGEAFAAGLDASDTVSITSGQAEDYDSRARPGGEANRITYRVIPPVRQASRYHDVSDGERSAIRKAVIRESLRSYGWAAAWSRPRGELGILMGHGAPLIGYDGARSYIVADFAPAGLARVNTRKLERLWERVRSGPSAALERGAPERRMEDKVDPSRDPLLSDLGPELSLIYDMGVAFRRHRVRRIDLLSCAIGYLDLGQLFIDTLHAIWRIPIRALIGLSGYGEVGNWVVEGLQDYRGMIRPQMNRGQRHVMPPLIPRHRGGILASGPYGTYFSDSMFRTSRMRRL
ncbi:MAG: hypothetical protein IT378_20200 [Sandaracinaceae bacterium]|nr:hypothetical protein [Sandaracinaceae bacterium]